MNKTIFFIATLAAISLEASPCSQQEWKETPIECETNHSFRYCSFGIGPLIMLPTFGVGYRSQRGLHGFDASLEYSTVISAHRLQAAVLYHRYQTPLAPASWYLGAGIAGNLGLTNDGDAGYLISPDFVIGKQWTDPNARRKFLEMHTLTPHLTTHGYFSAFPLVSFKYGVAF